MKHGLRLAINLVHFLHGIVMLRIWADESNSGRNAQNPHAYHRFKDGWAACCYFWRLDGLLFFENLSSGILTVMILLNGDLARSLNRLAI